ncbi:MAG: prolyl oligopeptidase family serine peptidase [Planctomycetota bacterium]|nr:prolyl oligopeptidase family serine peptidase [Planctomycetota bacterium]
MGVLLAASLVSCTLAPPVEQGPKPLALEEIAAFPRIGGLAFSPDSRRIVYASDATGNWSLYTVRLSGGRAERITYSPEAALAPSWSPDGNWVSYISDHAGNEIYDIYAISADGGRPLRLTTREADDREPHWSPDSSKIVFSSDREPRPDGEKGYAIYSITLETGEVTRLTNANGDDHEPRWSPKGDQIAFTSTRDSGNRGSDIYVIPSNGGKAKKLTTHEGGTDGHPRWLSNGEEIFFHSDLSGFYDIGRVAVARGAVRWIKKDPLDQVGPEISSKGMMAYTSNDDGNLVVELTSIGRSRGKLSRTTWDDGVTSHPVWSPDGNMLAFTHSGPARPGEIWVYRRSTGEIDPVIEDLSVAEVSEQLMVPERVQFEADGGGSLSGFLYGVKTGKALGAIVWLHDGLRGQWLNGWSPEIQSLVASGYVVLAPNFRGSTGRGADFEETNDRNWGEAEIADVQAAALFLEEQGFARSGQIAVGGTGYGGFLALLTVSLKPYADEYAWAAALSVSGWTNLESTYRRGHSRFQRQLRSEVGDPNIDADQEWYRYLSPIRNVSAIKCPVLLIGGKKDAFVTEKELLKMKRALERQDKKVELITYDDDGRGLRQRQNRLSSLHYIRNFLRKHIPG